MPRIWLKSLLAALALFWMTGTAVSADLGILRGPGHVLIIRHALAPGTGDPANFDVDRCETQRNLNDVGRAQSRDWGERLKGAGIDPARILSSQWCRCLETARLMDVGHVEEFWPLNSFFTRREDRDKNLNALRDTFASLPPDGPLVVMVTHQVTITAVTGRGVSSGEGWVLKLNGTREPEVVGSIPAP